VIVQCETVDIGAEYGDVRPLDEVRIRLLSINAGEVLDRITSDVAFVTELANAGCITWPQRDHLINIIQPRDRNEKLTEFLTRRSVAHFQKFISVLAKGHDFLVPFFLNDEGEPFSVKEEQQRVAVVDPETHVSFLFARCRPTLPRCGVESSVGL